MKKINEYDFNKMLENFKFQDALLKLKKKRIQKIKTDNSLFQQNVHKMRLKTQEAEVKRIREIKRNIEEKTAEVESNQFEKNKEKKEKMLKARNDRIRMEKTAKSNVESHLANLEERRLEEAERTIDRCKYLITKNLIINYTVRSFQEKHNEMRQEKKMSYSKKLKENVDKYNQHYLIQMEREALLTQTREDEKLKKYTETVSFNTVINNHQFWKQKERMNKIKKKKEKHLVHLDKIREIKEQRENDLKRKKNRIMQKIESMIKKRNNLEEEHHRRLEEELREEENKKKEVTNRLEIIKRNENEFRDAVLLYQQDLIFRALDKENATNLKRSNAQ